MCIDRFHGQMGLAVVAVCFLVGLYTDAVAVGAARTDQQCASIRQCEKYRQHCCEHPATAAVCTVLAGPTACAYRHPVFGLMQLASPARQPRPVEFSWLLELERSSDGLFSRH